MMGNITKWVSRITTILLLIVLLVMIFIVISTKANGNVFGYQLKTVLSGSMEPDIQTGSIIAVKLADDVNNFKEGDIVTFHAPDHGFVTHRIHGVGEDGQKYVTKGDANKTPDTDPLLADNIVAQYKGFTIPYVGYIINYFEPKERTALLFIVPGLLLLVFSSITIWKVFRDIEGKREKPVTEGKHS